jgi:hypothetical protein
MDLFGGFGEALGGEGAGEVIEGLFGALLGGEAASRADEASDVVYERRFSRRNREPNVNDI